MRDGASPWAQANIPIASAGGTYAGRKLILSISGSRLACDPPEAVHQAEHQYDHVQIVQFDRAMRAIDAWTLATRRRKAPESLDPRRHRRQCHSGEGIDSPSNIR